MSEPTPEQIAIVEAKIKDYETLAQSLISESRDLAMRVPNALEALLASWRERGTALKALEFHGHKPSLRRYMDSLLPACLVCGDVWPCNEAKEWGANRRVCAQCPRPAELSQDLCGMCRLESEVASLRRQLEEARAIREKGE